MAATRVAPSSLSCFCCRLLVKSVKDLRAEGTKYDELLKYVEV